MLTKKSQVVLMLTCGLISAYPPWVIAEKGGYKVVNHTIVYAPLYSPPGSIGPPSISLDVLGLQLIIAFAVVFLLDYILLLTPRRTPVPPTEPVSHSPHPHPANRRFVSKISYFILGLVYVAASVAGVQALRFYQTKTAEPVVGQIVEQSYFNPPLKPK